MLASATPAFKARRWSTAPIPASSPLVLARSESIDTTAGSRANTFIAAVALPAVEDARRIAELERKIGQLTMENDFLKKALQHFRDHHPSAVVSGGDACLKRSSKPRRKAKP
jgi:hypothetical protein